METNVYIKDFFKGDKPLPVDSKIRFYFGDRHYEYFDVCLLNRGLIIRIDGELNIIPMAANTIELKRKEE